MQVAKLGAIGSLNAMKSGEGNDSLDTLIHQAMGRESVVCFPRTGDSPVQWVQLLNTLDQPDLLGWPLFTPMKIQLLKCEKCSEEFCSPINYRRHIRLHRRRSRSLNIDKESHKSRDLLGSFWDNLSLEDAKNVVSFDDISLKEVSGSSVIIALANGLRKPGAWTMPQTYLKAGSILLEIIQAKYSGLPISSQELFVILDDASERTFLCAGTAESVQKFIIDGGAEEALEMRNLVASVSLLLEQKLVRAWLADKDAESLRCQKLLVEEEEAAEKRRSQLLERRKKKQLRQQEQKAREQSNCEMIGNIADSGDGPSVAEISVSQVPFENNQDIVTDPVPKPSQLPTEAIVEARSDSSSDQVNGDSVQNFESWMEMENSHPPATINEWQVPKSRSQRSGRYRSQRSEMIGNIADSGDQPYMAEISVSQVSFENNQDIVTDPVPKPSQLPNEAIVEACSDSTSDQVNGDSVQNFESWMEMENSRPPATINEWQGPKSRSQLRGGRYRSQRSEMIGNIADSADWPSVAEISVSRVSSENNQDIVTDPVPKPSQFSNEAIVEARSDSCSDQVNDDSVQNFVSWMEMENGHPPATINGWQVPKSRSQRSGRYSNYGSQNLQTVKPEPFQKQGLLKDRNVVNSGKVWTRKSKTEISDASLELNLQKIETNNIGKSNAELLIGSISIPVRSTTAEKYGASNACNVDIASSKEDNFPKEILKSNSAQEEIDQSTARSISICPAQRSDLPVQSGNQDSVDIVASEKVEDSSCANRETCVQLCPTDKDNCGNISNLEKKYQPQGMLFSSDAAKAFLAQRWKDAISADHVKLVLSHEAPGRPDGQNDSSLMEVPSGGVLKLWDGGDSETRLPSIEANVAPIDKNTKAKFQRKERPR